MRKLHLEFTPFPILETNRLQLIKPDVIHKEGYLALRSNPRSMLFIPRKSFENIEEALEFISMIVDSIEKNLYIAWTIIDKETTDFIGSISFHSINKEYLSAEIGYAILPQYWGKGIVFEAASALIAYGFKCMNVHRIEAFVDPRNQGSIRVLEKLSFKKEGHLVDQCYFNNEFSDTLIYALLESK